MKRASDETKTFPTLEVGANGNSILEDASRTELERSVLPTFLRMQRWFGGKGRQIEGVRVADWGDFPAGAARIFLMMLEVKFADGKDDLYFVPIGVTRGEDATRMLSSMESSVIARLQGPGGEAILHDALADDDTCMSLLTAIEGGREFAMHAGRVRAFSTAAFAALRGKPEQTLSVERGPATSSNSLLFYGERLLLKLFRRLETGINPDFEIGRFLTEANAFERIPRVAGTIEYRREGSQPITLAILQAMVPNQGDGWRHALDELGRYYEGVSKRTSSSAALAPDNRSLLDLAEASPPPDAVERIGDYLQAAAMLGRRTAEMHLALSADSGNPDFAPEPFTPTDAAALRASIREQGQLALAALRDNLGQLPQEIAEAARGLLENGSEVLNHLEDESPLPAKAVKIRCHGDYHLGQVLRVDNDFVLLDFEGEPTRTVEERRAKRSPLKDVAGMVRSYHYASYAGLFAFTQDRSDDFSRLEPWADLWYQWVSAAFLREYRLAAKGAAFLPDDPSSFTALLDAFTLDKAFYELNYELNNRPDWVRIPLRGILALLNKEHQETGFRAKGSTP